MGGDGTAVAAYCRGVTLPALDTRGRALRDLRVSVTDRCNFRCPYCMPREVFGTDHAFLPRDELLSFEELARLAAVEPVHAMTVHRSQGSQFDTVTVLAAPERSPLATREMFYTALTRAKVRVRVVGSAEAVAAAVSRPLARATGLADRLRG